MKYKKPFGRTNHYGVKRRQYSTYNTNQYGLEEKDGWWKLQKQICERDGYKCRWCNKKANTVHHIVPRSRNGTNHPNNLACICNDCHEKRPYHSHMHSHSHSHHDEDPF